MQDKSACYTLLGTGETDVGYGDSCATRKKPGETSGAFRVAE